MLKMTRLWSKASVNDMKILFSVQFNSHVCSYLQATVSEIDRWNFAHRLVSGNFWKLSTYASMWLVNRFLPVKEYSCARLPNANIGLPQDTGTCFKQICWLRNQLGYTNHHYMQSFSSTTFTASFEWAQFKLSNLRISQFTVLSKPPQSHYQLHVWAGEKPSLITGNHSPMPPTIFIGWKNAYDVAFAKNANIPCKNSSNDTFSLDFSSYQQLWLIWLLSSSAFTKCECCWTTFVLSCA
jgi:hypothetical protein